jgi:hypothetical protein
VTHLGVYTPSSEAIQVAYVIPSSLVYSSYKASWIRVLLQASGIVRIGKKDTNEKNVLLVEDMKHNILSVSQMCDQGHKLVFDSQKGEIRKEYSGRVVVIVVRTPSNIYALSEIGKEKCYLGKEDEVWLWHIIMDNINFDNLVKVSKKELVREIP